MAGSGDGARSKEDWHAQSTCAAVRQECVGRLQELVAASTMFTERDMATYAKGALSDESLERVGKTTFEDKTRALEENRDLYIPQTAQKVVELERTFYTEVARGEAKGWLSPRAAKNLRDQFVSANFHWWQKEVFIEEKLPVYLGKRRALHENTERMEKLLVQMPAARELAAVKKARKNTFKNLEEKMNTINEALAAIEAQRTGRTGLFVQAKQALEKAAHDEVLSKNKVGKWLQKIMESSAAPEKIAAFISGKGVSSLPELVRNWTSVRRRFDKIECNRRKKGTPRSFYFVSTEKFLDWHYAKRLAYVEEAERRFVDISKETPILINIRHELDYQDWDAAEILIAQAEGMGLSSEDLEKVRSMRKYLKENKPKSAKPTRETPPNVAYAQLQEALASLPLPLAELCRKAIKAGKFDCLSALMYNRVWCHVHHHLDENKEVRLRERAAEDTKRQLQSGTRKKERMLNRDVDAFKKPSIASYTYTNLNKPQILHTSMAGHDALIARMREEDSHRFRYWSTLVPEDVPYELQAYAVNHTNRIIKRCLRALGPYGMLQTAPVAKERRQESRGPQYALHP